MPTDPCCIMCCSTVSGAGILTSCQHFVCDRCHAKFGGGAPGSSTTNCPRCKTQSKFIVLQSASFPKGIMDQISADPVANLKSLLSAVEFQSNADKSIIVRLKELVTALNTSNTNFRNKVATLDAKISALNAELGDAKQRNLNLEAQLRGGGGNGQHPPPPLPNQQQTQQLPSMFYPSGNQSQQQQPQQHQPHMGSVSMSRGYEGQRDQSYAPTPSLITPSASMANNAHVASMLQPLSTPILLGQLGATPQAAGRMSSSFNDTSIVPTQYHQNQMSNPMPQQQPQHPMQQQQQQQPYLFQVQQQPLPALPSMPHNSTNLPSAPMSWGLGGSAKKRDREGGETHNQSNSTSHLSGNSHNQTTSSAAADRFVSSSLMELATIAAAASNQHTNSRITSTNLQQQQQQATAQQLRGAVELSTPAAQVYNLNALTERVAPPPPPPPQPQQHHHQYPPGAFDIVPEPSKRGGSPVAPYTSPGAANIRGNTHSGGGGGGLDANRLAYLTSKGSNGGGSNGGGSLHKNVSHSNTTPNRKAAPNNHHYPPGSQRQPMATPSLTLDNLATHNSRMPITKVII